MKIRILYFCSVFLIFFIITGCAPKKMYYWGNYSNTLYNYRKEPGPETLLKHREELDKIVKQSSIKSLKIPPGVYAELGYIYFRQNNFEEAINYFQLEKKLYPESHVFMKRLVKAAELRDKNASTDNEKK